MTRPAAIRTKITMPTGEVWYATCPQIARKTPQQCVDHLNKISKAHNVGSTYELATEEAYWKYRAETKTRSLQADIPVEWKPST